MTPTDQPHPIARNSPNPLNMPKQRLRRLPALHIPDPNRIIQTARNDHRLLLPPFRRTTVKTSHARSPALSINRERKGRNARCHGDLDVRIFVHGPLSDDRFVARMTRRYGSFGCRRRHGGRAAFGVVAAHVEEAQALDLTHVACVLTDACTEVEVPEADGAVVRGGEEHLAGIDAWCATAAAA